jgi:hypothetical protein
MTAVSRLGPDFAGHTGGMSANRRPWDDSWDEDQAWVETWMPKCPDRNPQRLCEILGFRLKGPEYLQLRVVLTPADWGVCNAIIEEHPDLVYVRAIACYDDGWPPRQRPGCLYGDTDCPCSVYLDAPLGERIVIDIDSGEPLPMFIPRWVPASDPFMSRVLRGICGHRTRNRTAPDRHANYTPGPSNVHALGLRANAVRGEAEHPISSRD